MSHDLWLKITAYTGFDSWMYLLSDASQAARLAKRFKVSLVVVPSGSAWKVVEGEAFPVTRPDLGQF